MPPVHCWPHFLLPIKSVKENAKFVCVFQRNYPREQSSIGFVRSFQFIFPKSKFNFNPFSVESKLLPFPSPSANSLHCFPINFASEHLQLFIRISTNEIGQKLSIFYAMEKVEDEEGCKGKLKLKTLIFKGILPTFNVVFALNPNFWNNFALPILVHPIHFL
jgi:hypothetical protein